MQAEFKPAIKDFHLRTFGIFIIFFISLILPYAHSQTFREVKSADDVLYNYIQATGNRSRLDTLKSIFFTGKLIHEGKEYKFNCFMSRERFHYTINDKAVKPLGEFGRDNIQYLNLPIFEHSGMTVQTGFLFYLAYKLEGIAIELEGTEIIGGRNCYKIGFTAATANGRKFIKTAYFDKETFYKLKTVNRDFEKNRFEINFSETKEVNGTGVFLPYEFNSGKPGFKFQIKEFLLNEEPEIEW